MLEKEIRVWAQRLQRLRPSEIARWSERLQGYDLGALQKLSKQWVLWGGRFFAWEKTRDFVRMRQLFGADQITDELSWSHYRQLMQIDGADTRAFYCRQAIQHGWTVQQLVRQIRSQYHCRVAGSSTFPSLEHFVFDFLADQALQSEQALEAALLSNLEHFFLELGRGFAFVGRQQRIRTQGGKSMRVDLIFYHYLLQCFVLLELKMGSVSHRDIGQLDGYVRLFDERYRGVQHQPTLGILLCRSKDEEVVRYSVVEDRMQLHVATFTVEQAGIQEPKND